MLPIRAFLCFATLVLIGACASPTASSSTSARTTASTASIAVVVLDSVNGSPVPGATVTVLDGSSATVHTGTTGSSGTTAAFSLTAGSSYNITAYASGTAASTMQDFIAVDGTTITLYCHTIGISGVAATAPTVQSILYSSDGTNWSVLNNGATMGSGFQIKASVLGAVAVKATTWSGFGIGIDFDAMPTATKGWNSSSSSLVTTVTDAVYDSSTSEYQTVDQFNFSNLNLQTGTHTLELVAYDVANNRVEKHITFSVE